MTIEEPKKQYLLYASSKWECIMNKEFWELTTNDREQKIYKDRMELCYVIFIDILGFKEMVEKDIDKVILAMRILNTF